MGADDIGAEELRNAASCNNSGCKSYSGVPPSNNNLEDCHSKNGGKILLITYESINLLLEVQGFPKKIFHSDFVARTA